MNFTYRVTEQEANTILQALAARPFAEVYQLVGNLQSQAKAQMDAENNKQIVADALEVLENVS